MLLRELVEGEEHMGRTYVLTLKTWSEYDRAHHTYGRIHWSVRESDSTATERGAVNYRGRGDEDMTRHIGTEFDTDEPAEAPIAHPGDGDRWGWADCENPEMWNGADSREEALREGRANVGPGGTFWIQEGLQATAEFHLPSATEFIETMEQSASDNGCPDGIDEPFVFRDGAEAALEKLLAQWAKEYVVACNWWEAFGKPERIDPVGNTALDPGVAKAMAGGDSAARFGGDPPETEFEG